MATAYTGLQDLASSRHPDVLRPDYSVSDSPASLFPLPARSQLKNATAALPAAVPTSQGTGSGHAPFLSIHPAFTNTLLANCPSSWQAAGAFPAFSSSSPHAVALLPSLPAFLFPSSPTRRCSIPKKYRNFWAGAGELQLLPQGLIKGHSKLRWDLGHSHGHKETSVSR